MKYKFFKAPNGTQENAVIRTTDDGMISTVPFDETNTDYQAYLLWVSEGGVTEAAD